MSKHEFLVKFTTDGGKHWTFGKLDELKNVVVLPSGTKLSVTQDGGVKIKEQECRLFSASHEV